MEEGVEVDDALDTVRGETQRHGGDGAAERVADEHGGGDGFGGEDGVDGSREQLDVVLDVGRSGAAVARQVDHDAAVRGEQGALTVPELGAARPAVDEDKDWDVGGGPGSGRVGVVHHMDAIRNDGFLFACSCYCHDEVKLLRGLPLRVCLQESSIFILGLAQAVICKLTNSICSVLMKHQVHVLR